MKQRSAKPGKSENDVISEKEEELAEEGYSSCRHRFSDPEYRIRFIKTSMFVFCWFAKVRNGIVSARNYVKCFVNVTLVYVINEYFLIRALASL